MSRQLWRPIHGPIEGRSDCNASHLLSRRMRRFSWWSSHLLAVSKVKHILSFLSARLNGGRLCLGPSIEREGPFLVLPFSSCFFIGALEGLDDRRVMLA